MSSRVVQERDHGTRIVRGVELRINELIWNDDGRSFEVFRVSDGKDFTSDECFDSYPTDTQLEALLDAEKN